MVKDVIGRVVENIVKAYESFKEITGSPIPEDVLRRVIDEVEHIAIHELAHGAIRAVYHEIDDIEERGHILGECIDEILGRLLETYVSAKISAHIHSFEEHVYELKNYTSLSKLDIKVEDLEELYRQVTKSLGRKELRNTIDIVAKKCEEWIKQTTSNP